MKKRFFAAIVGTALSSIAYAQVPPGVTLGKVNVVGTGCDLSDTLVAVSGDQQALTLVFNNLFVELDGRRTTRKYCRSIFTVRKPVGWTFDIVNNAYRGFVSLDEGVTASHSTFYDVGRTRNQFEAQNFAGETFEDFERFDTVVPRPNLSTCNTRLERVIIHNVLSMTAHTPGGTGLLVIDSQDNEVQGQFTYGIRWRRC
ncbi:MAG: DUF4360 domain-containing protein [Pseudobacteriovorax sp.]|nr:DUF4360 domain-containing protein [Pseudobacteriovorax sp.]